MILFGCLLAFGAAVAPRVILVIAWLFSERWDLVWRGDFLVPLLGILFLPYTTIMYMLTVTVTVTGVSIAGLDWIWILLGLILDVMKWGQVIANRRAGQEYATHYYPAGAPGSSMVRSDSTATAEAEVSTGAVPPSTDATATDVDAGSDDAPAGGGSSKD